MKTHSLFLSFVMLFVLAVFGVGSARAEDWQADFNESDAAFNGGNGYADSTDSSALAWWESYLLQAYLQMYQTYGDTAYLDKFISHADQVIAHLSDPDGDGNLGWQTTDYAPQKLANPGFEAASGPTYDPASWTRWQASTTTAYRSINPADLHGSSAALVIKTNGKNWIVEEQTLASYIPGAAYELDFWGKTNGVVGGRIEVQDATTRKTLASQKFYNTAWGSGGLSFAAPTVAGHVLKVRLYTDAYIPTGGKVVFDDLSMKMLEEYLIHDTQVLLPLVRYATAVADDPSLYSDPFYSGKADDYTDLVELMLLKWLPYWVDLPGTSPQQSVLVTNPLEALGAVPGNTLPYNQFLDFSRLLLGLGYITGDSGYLYAADQLGETLNAHLIRNPTTPSAIWWDYSQPLLPGDVNKHPVATTSSSNLTVAAMMESFFSGGTFDVPDMFGLVSTFLDVLADTTTTPPRFSESVLYHAPLSDALNLRDWIDLTVFHPYVWDLASAQLQAVLDARRTAGQPLLTTGSEFLTLSKIAYWDPSLSCGCGPPI